MFSSLNLFGEIVPDENYVKNSVFITCVKSSTPGFAPTTGTAVQTVFVKELIKYPQEGPPPSVPVEVQLVQSGATLISPPQETLTVPVAEEKKPISPLPAPDKTTEDLIQPKGEIKVTEQPTIQPFQIAGLPPWGILLLAGAVLAFLFKRNGSLENESYKRTKKMGG